MTPALTVSPPPRPDEATGVGCRQPVGGRLCGRQPIVGWSRCAEHLAALRAAAAQEYLVRRNQATPIGRTLLDRALELGITLAEAATGMGIADKTVSRLVWEGAPRFGTATWL